MCMLPTYLSPVKYFENKIIQFIMCKLGDFHIIHILSRLIYLNAKGWPWGAVPSTVLCKSCSALLCVQERVDKSSASPHGANCLNCSNWHMADPVYDCHIIHILV